MLDYQPIRNEEESSFVKRLPVIFVFINFAVSVPFLLWLIVATIIGAPLPGDKIAAPALIVALLDFPSSLIASTWSDLLSQYSKRYDNSEIASAIGISVMMLLCGATQFYLVGRAVRWFIRHRRARRRRKQNA
jgi:hypothetical protein